MRETLNATVDRLNERRESETKGGETHQLSQMVQASAAPEPTPGLNLNLFVATSAHAVRQRYVHGTALVASPRRCSMCT